MDIKDFLLIFFIGGVKFDWSVLPTLFENA